MSEKIIVGVNGNITVDLLSLQRVDCKKSFIS